MQQAVDSASPGNTMKIAGTCAGVQETGGLTQTVYISQNLTLRGGYSSTDWTASDPDANPTTLNAQSLGRVLVITGTADVQLENLIVREGNASAGGGLYVDTAASLSLLSSQVLSNTATGSGLFDGGGGGLGNLGQTVISDTTFSDNRAIGSVAGAVGNGPQAKLTVTDSTFRDNQAATAGALGNTGWVTVTASSFISNIANEAGAIGNGQLLGGPGWMLIENSIFLNHTVSGNGGAIDNDGGEMYLIGTTFESNRAKDGGAIYNNSTTSGQPPVLVIRNSTFLSNTVSSDGGAIRHRTGTSQIEESAFGYNTAARHGGALYNQSILSLNAVTVTHNSAGSNGGGVDSGNGDNLTIARSILANNHAGKQGGGLYSVSSTIVTNSLFAGNSAASTLGAAVYLNGGSAQIVHTTIASSTLGSGSAVYIASGTAGITNTLIASHALGLEGAGGTLSENYNLFAGVTTPYSGTILSSGQSLSGTAAFYDTANYTLTIGSAALDAGMDAGITSDFFGKPRPAGAGYDIGYDESPYAHFVLAVATAGTGSGMVTPTVGLTIYPYGTVVTPMVTADVGSNFAGWDGDCSGTDTCALAMTTSRSVTATFTLNQYSIVTATDGTGSGSVILDPTGGVYDYGTVVTLTATAETGSSFTDWSGAVVSTTNPVTLTVGADKTITGTFTLNQYSITSATDGTGSGSVSLDPSGGVYDYGTVITLTAIADTGSSFSDWSGAVVSTTNPVTLTVDGNKIIIGTFGINQYSVATATAGAGNGNISLDPAGGVYDYGTVVTLTATAETGSSFTDWSGAVVSTSNPVTLTVDGNKMITATFALNPTATPTATATPSATPTLTSTPVTPTVTPTATNTPVTPTPTSTSTSTAPTATPTATASSTPTATNTAPTATPTATATATVTQPASTPTTTASSTPNATDKAPTATPTATVTQPVSTSTATASSTPTATGMPSTATATATDTAPTATPTATATQPTSTPTATGTPSTATATATGTASTATPTATTSRTPTATDTAPASTPTATASRTPTATNTASTATPTATVSSTPTATGTAPASTPTATASRTPTATDTAPTATPTATATSTNAATSTLTATPTPTQTTSDDPDGDGISAGEENSVPNLNGSGSGDGNGDGIPDANQPHVSSFRNGQDGGYLTLTAGQGQRVTGVTVATSPADLPFGVRLPQGVIGFSLGGVPTGGGVTVHLTVHSGNSPIDYWKFGPTGDDPTPHWYSFAFDGTTGGIVLDSRTVQLQLVDGGRGDSDLTANGVIVDPGGPGGQVSFPRWLPFISSGIGVESSELGSALLWLPLVHTSAE